MTTKQRAATNRQRAAALLAHRIAYIGTEPVDAQEIRDALGEDIDFQATTVKQVAQAVEALLLPIVDRLDNITGADRYPSLTVPAEEPS